MNLTSINETSHSRFQEKLYPRSLTALALIWASVSLSELPVDALKEGSKQQGRVHMCGGTEMNGVWGCVCAHTRVHGRNEIKCSD